MVKTIGNPLSWGAGAVTGAGAMIAHGSEAMASQDMALPEVRQLSSSDLWDALREGFDDLTTFRSDVLMMAVIYPLVGLTLCFFAFQQALLPLLFPIAAGFALLGPLAATGLYEMSRTRQAEGRASWADALMLMSSPRFAPIMTLGLYLIVLYAIWLYAAAWIYSQTLGGLAPAGPVEFLRLLFTTGEGWQMIVFGNAVGFLFALTVLATGFIAFPMLVDRPVGLPVAVATSLKAARENKAVTLTWGAMIAVLLALGSAPLFLGLIFVMPLLGHASWHLYRKAVHFPEAK